MNSPLIRSSVTLRVTRPIGGADRMPIANAVFTRLGGVMARISSTSRIGGNAIMMSSTRMIVSSIALRR